MINEIISQLVKGKDLNFSQTEKVFKDIFDEKISPVQIAAFLIALKIKKETYKEISAAASVIRDKAIKIKLKKKDSAGMDIPVLDTCGTGGGGAGKFNISTAAAFVVAASGVIVAKHGNKAMSSSCGSADVLEELGINISVEPDIMKKTINKTGIGFLFAPVYHPAFKVVAPVRREIGVGTVFNILGPLCNPAGADHQVLGVFSPHLITPMAKALGVLGVKRAFVVYGKDLGDEITLTGETMAVLLNNRRLKQFTFTPADFGLRKHRLRDLKVRDAGESARVVLDVFKGKEGPCQDAVLANAGACLCLLKKTTGLKQGVIMAKELIKSGAVLDKFYQFRNFLRTYERS